MGPVQSVARNEVLLEMSQALTFITNLIQNNSQTVGQTSTRGNTFTLETGPGSDVHFKGKFINNQTIDAKDQATGQMKTEISSDVKTQLTNILKEAVDQSASAKAGAFATSSTRTTNITKTKTAIEATIQDYFNQTNIQSVAQSVVDTNTGKVVLNGKVTVDEDFVNDQKIFSKLIASSVMDSLISRINQYFSDNKVDLTVKQKAKSTSSGLLSFLDNPWFITGSIVSSCAIMIIVIVLYMAYSKSKSNK